MSQTQAQTTATQYKPSRPELSPVNNLPNYVKCEVCGGYGYKHPQGTGSPMRCPSCKGDKMSRNPKHEERNRSFLEGKK